jgi:RNA polymerase sigma factor (sigma-70 family)
LAVINQAPSYTNTAKFTTWLFRIAHNRLVDHWRKHSNRHTLVLDEVSEQLSHDGNIVRGLEIEELFSNLSVLPAKKIEALLLKIEGFSHSQIAEITNTKQETVKSRLRYATAQLRATAELRV